MIACSPNYQFVNFIQWAIYFRSSRSSLIRVDTMSYYLVVVVVHDQHKHSDIESGGRDIVRGFHLVS